MIARKKGLLKPLEAHPTASIWARFRNVKDLDGKEVAGVDPADPFVRPVIAARRLATNHFVGFGYWIWFIPLKGGETSVGLVWDKRLIDPQGANPEEKLLRFLDGNPLTKEMLEKAEIVPGDTRFYGHLPYLNDRVVGEGWSLVGDAAGFLDPFYSPGLDQMAFSVSWTLELIKRRRMLAPEAFAKELEIHNRRYRPLLRLLLRLDLPGQVLADGGLRHDDVVVPDRHGALLPRGRHSRLPLVGRPRAGAAVLPGLFGGGLLPDAVLPAPPHLHREAEARARHLREPQRGSAPGPRRLLAPVERLGHAGARPRPLAEGRARERL